MSPANSKYVDAEFAAENTAADTGVAPRNAGAVPGGAAGRNAAADTEFAAGNAFADTEFGVESEGAASALNNPQANRISKKQPEQL